MTPAGVGLRVARVMAPVHNLGPGVRLAIWVQGCGLGCPGCVSPDLWDKTGGRALGLDELAALCLQHGTICSGLTVSGGEPFDQYEGLLALALWVRRALNWPTHVFTGYTLEELEERHPDRAFAHVLDSLVDGRFEARRPSTARWRGSTNQRLFAFVDGTAVEQPEGFAVGSWAIAADEGSVWMAGIPARGDLAAVAKSAAQAGLRLTPAARTGTKSRFR